MTNDYGLTETQMALLPQWTRREAQRHYMKLLEPEGDRVCQKDYCDWPCPEYGEISELIELLKASPDDLREQGWAVGVHNDYRQDGVQHTFWLLTKGDRCVKGEGLTDREALNQIRAALAELGAQA